MADTVEEMYETEVSRKVVRTSYKIQEVSTKFCSFRSEWRIFQEHEHFHSECWAGRQFVKLRLHTHARHEGNANTHRPHDNTYYDGKLFKALRPSSGIFKRVFSSDICFSVAIVCRFEKTYSGKEYAFVVYSLSQQALGLSTQIQVWRILAQRTLKLNLMSAYTDWGCSLLQIYARTLCTYVRISARIKRGGRK